MKNYTNIFNVYYTQEDEPFYFLSKSVVFPEDKSLYFYKKYYIQDDIPWTILSYQLYGTIDYWWVLAALNKSMIFYAERGETIWIIHPDNLEDILSNIR